MSDDLRPEYDLGQMRVRRMGRDRARFGDMVRLAPDVSRLFPDAESVNEALRFLVRAVGQQVGGEKHPFVIDTTVQEPETAEGVTR